MTGYVIIVLATVGFGLLVYIDNDLAFMISGLFLRFFQGFGDAMVSTASYSMITIEFPEEKEKYFGYC